MKTLWDSKQRFVLPNGEECWEWIKEEFIILSNANAKIRKLWANLGFFL
jgi:hypothetical protein